MEKWLRSSQQMVLRMQVSLPVRIDGQPPVGGAKGNNDDAADSDDAVPGLMMGELKRDANIEEDKVEGTSAVNALEYEPRLLESEMVPAKEEDEVVVRSVEVVLEVVVVAIEVTSVASAGVELGAKLLVAIEGLFDAVEIDRVEEDEYAL